MSSFRVKILPDKSQNSLTIVDLQKDDFPLFFLTCGNPERGVLETNRKVHASGRELQKIDTRTNLPHGLS